MNEMLALLSQLLETEGVSDIFISAGKTPYIRLYGIVKPDERFNGMVVDSADIDAFRQSVAGEDEEKSYRRSGGLDTSFTLPPERRCRINFFSTVGGPAFVMRPIRRGDDINFEDLHLPVQHMTDIGNLQRGIVLFTGTTGCGKSSSMNALINYINQNSNRHILTIEDPIEFIHNDINSLVTQREISIGTTFSGALRNALRENPDVIVIGELRDNETVQVALSAALTGHMVIATIHTSDAISTVERLVSMFPESVRSQAAADLAVALEAIVSQRLLKRADDSGLVPAVEILRATELARRQITKRDFNGLDATMNAGTYSGMITFNQSLFNLCSSGTVEVDEALRSSSNPDELRRILQGMQNGTVVDGRQYGISDSGNPDMIDMKSLFRAAVRSRASDLILSVSTPPILRIDGICRSLELPPLSSESIQHLLYSIINRRQRAALEETRELDLSIAVELPAKRPGEAAATNRFRVNAFYQRGSLGMVARVVNNYIPEPAELNLPPVLLEIMKRKQGLVLFSGPTGSGKSTSMASLLNMVNRERACHIVTIEDPIEYMYKNELSVIEQREVNADTRNFAGALRAAMRQAPDIIMVGEMRDPDTIATALSAAETGHLVLGTIHTNSAVQSVDRIIDSFPASQQNQVRQQLAASLLAVVSQRLLPRVDRPGRVGAFEIMIGTPPVQALIRECKTHMLQSTLEIGQNEGMITLQNSLEKLCVAGIISPEQLIAFGIKKIETVKQ